MAIKKVSGDQAREGKGTTNWDEVDKIADEEIEASVSDDPDTGLPTAEELKEFTPIKKKKVNSCY